MKKYEKIGLCLFLLSCTIFNQSLEYPIHFIINIIFMMVGAVLFVINGDVK